MASAARLACLRQVTQANIDALPDRPSEPIISDSDVPGGVTFEPGVEKPNKQTAADPAQHRSKPTSEEPNTDRQYVWLKDAQSAYKPAPMPRSTITTAALKPSASLPTIDLQRGDLAPAQQHYTPIQALAKYPYKFCNRAHQQDIASAFFDQGKFWAREWDLYYVWGIDNLSKPLILVRESQFQDLLNEISDHLKLDLRITDQQREDALVSRFPDHPRCTPRYLGRSRSREEYDDMVDNAPDHDFRAAGEPDRPPLDESSLEAFKQLMEDSFEAQKAKNKAARVKRQEERLMKQKTMADQFKRAQRYLGLRPAPVADAASPRGLPAAADPASPASFDFDRSVVFVCVDVESYERAHHKITEVGVATLDTQELVGIPPGQDGENWRGLIRARHFRIKEHAHLVNHEFVAGNPERFNFGISTFVPLVDAPAHVAACFSPPFGAHQPTSAEDIAELMNGVDLNGKRNIIFLGHDTLGDVRYLQNLGFDPMKVENLLEALDTAVMYRVWRREQQPTSLSRILYEFDIAGYNLHNAGNDAVFTVQAMLAICVREASMRGSPELENMRETKKSARLAEALEEAQKRVNEEAEGWSDYDLDGDGGAPVPISISPPRLAPAHVASQTPSDSNSRGISRGRGRGRGGPQGTLYNPRQAAGGYGNNRGNAGGRSDHGQGGSARGPYRGGYSGQREKRSRGDGAPRIRGRGRGPSNTSSNNAREDQARLIDLN